MKIITPIEATPDFMRYCFELARYLRYIIPIFSLSFIVISPNKQNISVSLSECLRRTQNELTLVEARGRFCRFHHPSKNKFYKDPV